MGISVLMSAYINCRAEYISSALRSVWHDQKRKPDQIVLVLDGPVQRELYDFVHSFKSQIGSSMTITELPLSNGFAHALNHGLSYCNQEFIARMDSDDISLPNRFLDQESYLKNNLHVDVVGSWISEIDDVGTVTRDLVEYPQGNENCLKMFSYRDPIAHPTVMFRRSFFLKVKAYPTNIRLAEDTLLWYEGFLNGCIFSNIQIVSLKYRRASNFFVKRRDFRKAILLLLYRVFVINRNLSLGIKSDVYAVAYFVMTFFPAKMKNYLYKYFR